MAEPRRCERPGALEPMHRLSEMLFGLIMVLTFTGSFSVVSGAVDVRTMLLAALGCGIAWGLIDAVMYLLGCLHESGAKLQKVRALRAARSPEAAREALRSALPPYAAREVDAATLDRIAKAVLLQVPADARPGLTRADMLGAVNVFLVVVAANLPVVLPFLLFSDTFTALRVSNGVALLMLAVIGHAYGRVSGLRPGLTAIAMVVLGALLVALTIALGG
jgi:VIT1/CCC1 family predicted Fe2+/Mn2+ transporter